MDKLKYTKGCDVKKEKAVCIEHSNKIHALS